MILEIFLTLAITSFVISLSIKYISGAKSVFYSKKKLRAEFGVTRKRASSLGLSFLSFFLNTVKYISKHFPFSNFISIWKRAYLAIKHFLLLFSKKQ